MNSISRRLIALLLGALIVAALLSGVCTYYKAHDEINELFDYQLQQFALSLRDQKTFEQRPIATSEYEKEEDITIQVWNADGALLFVSFHDIPLPRSAKPGLQTVFFNNAVWRVFLLNDQGRTIQVSQPFEVRRAISVDFALRTIIPLLIIFPVLGLMIWLVVRYSLKPLTGVADRVSQLSPVSLEPLPKDDLPAEILPLVQRLNLLFNQLSHAFDIQKRFVADAAHELRTPLTVVKLQARILDRCTSEAERIEALSCLGTGIDRAVHLVGQLLTLARVAPEAPPTPREIVSLNDLVEQIMTEQTQIAINKGIYLGTRHDGTISVPGEPEALRSIIGNLIDNAIRYTLPGGTVDVTLYRDELTAIVEIVDSGPGISAEEKERVFDRFYRCKANVSTGCGLGLAIVQSAVTRHNGSIVLSEPSRGKGLRVVIKLPIDPYSPPIITKL